MDRFDDSPANMKNDLPFTELGNFFNTCPDGELLTRAEYFIFWFQCKMDITKDAVGLVDISETIFHRLYNTQDWLD